MSPRRRVGLLRIGRAALGLVAVAGCGSPRAARPEVPPPAVAVGVVEAGAPLATPPSDAGVADARAPGARPAPIITRTLPAPPGWVSRAAVTTTAFSRPATYFRILRASPDVCVPHRYEAGKVVSRQPGEPMLFGSAVGDDAYTRPFTLVSKYTLAKIEPLVFELRSDDWDYFDAKGKRYASTGKGIALCGEPRYTVVGESASAVELIEADLPFAAYDPAAVELWFKSEAACKASQRPPASPRGCS